MVEPIGQLKVLRRRALLVRVVCRGWAGNGESDLYAQSALVAWRLNRVISGWLMGHPNQQYHPNRSPWCAGSLVLAGLALRAWNWATRARVAWLESQLQAMIRDCADIRSITSSVSINEMLARHQPSLIALQRLASTQAPQTLTERALPAGGSGQRAQPTYDADTWPFLSI
jgi:hypothetical protein